MTDLEKKKAIWIKPNSKHEYKQVKGDEFRLMQINGSLSSVKTFESKEEAIKLGWRLKDE